jgi:hypothetical protein
MQLIEKRRGPLDAATRDDQRPPPECRRQRRDLAQCPRPEEDARGGGELKTHGELQPPNEFGGYRWETR